MDKNEQIVFVKVFIEQYSKLMLLLKLIYPAVELKFQKCGMAGWRDAYYALQSVYQQLTHETSETSGSAAG